VPGKDQPDHFERGDHSRRDACPVQRARHGPVAKDPVQGSAYE
jgi:hypothetical protein